MGTVLFPPMPMNLPLVAILSPDDFIFCDDAALIEAAQLAEVARVKTFRLAPDNGLPEEVFSAVALIIWHSIPIPASLIARLRNCRAIIRNGVGFDSVDISAAASRGIPVCNVPDYGTEEVADHAIALALALCRQLFPLDAEAKKLGWKIAVAPKMRRLRSLTFGIIGLGRIGIATALRAKALGFRVMFFDPYVRTGMHKAVGLERVNGLDELMVAADVVSVHCPLSAETRGMIGARELALLKPSAYLVNTARGDIVQKAPLFAVLRAGRLAGAGLDVVEGEPLRTAEEASTPHLIVTCHAAFCSPEGIVEMRTTSARIARAAVLKEPVWNQVN